MLNLLKVFLRGIITTLLLPVIVLVWVGYGVYCIFIFVFMFFKGVIDYFRGKSFNADLPEDLESRRILLEKEKQEAQSKEMMNMVYNNVFGQGRVLTPEAAEQNYQPQNPYNAPAPEKPVFDAPVENQEEIKEEPEDDNALRGN